MWEQLLVRAYTRSPQRLRAAVVRAVTPNYTVGVLAVVRRPDGRVLLVDLPYRPGWSLPGGDVGRGEPAGHAAARELREELGLEVTVSQPTVAYQRVHDRWVTFVVTVDLDEQAARAVRPHSPEIRAAAWFEPGGLPELDQDAVEPLAVALTA